MLIFKGLPVFFSSSPLPLVEYTTKLLRPQTWSPHLPAECYESKANMYQKKHADIPKEQKHQWNNQIFWSFLEHARSGGAWRRDVTWRDGLLVRPDVTWRDVTASLSTAAPVTSWRDVTWRPPCPQRRLWRPDVTWRDVTWRSLSTAAPACDVLTWRDGL